MTYDSKEGSDQLQKFVKDAAIGVAEATLKNPVGRVVTAPVWVPVATVVGLAAVSKQVTQAAMHQPIMTFEEAVKDFF